MCVCVCVCGGGGGGGEGGWKASMHAEQFFVFFFTIFELRRFGTSNINVHATPSPQPSIVFTIDNTKVFFVCCFFLCVFFVFFFQFFVGWLQVGDIFPIFPRNRN